MGCPGHIKIKEDFFEIEQLIKQTAEDDKTKEVSDRKDMQLMSEMYKNEVPAEFLCPITEELFVDPVMTCDGHSYERKAIEFWLQSHSTSPITNLNLTNKNLIQNGILKNLIKSFMDSK